MKTLTSFAAIVLTVAGIAHAQSRLTGRWQGETDGGSSIVLDLTVKDTALTGTMVRNGQTLVLSDGQVAKNTFTFKVKINDEIEGISGELSGDDIKVWLDRQGPSRAIVLKRVTTA